MSLAKNEPKGEIVIYRDEEGKTALEVILEEQNRLAKPKSDGCSLSEGQIRHITPSL